MIHNPEVRIAKMLREIKSYGFQPKIMRVKAIPCLFRELMLSSIIERHWIVWDDTSWYDGYWLFCTGANREAAVRRLLVKVRKARS